MLKTPSNSSSDTEEDGPEFFTPATSTFSLPEKIEHCSLPAPFLPPSVEQVDRQCRPLPSAFPSLPKNETPAVVAKGDAQTPDNWLKRNPALLRLTGKHPFNSEAPLTPLFNAGFLTPAHLHVVRNHGAVPQVDDEKLRNWKICVHGLVERECEFSIEDLKDRFQVFTLPVTVVCAGNRRKEQNVVRKSLGFSWGASGLSTALWTGVYLSDVLLYVRPLRKRGAKYVIFEGGDTLPNGPYGTSQRLNLATNRENGMLIAWAMNGLPLEPDHGFPVRMIIPGQIGGRMVKWLRRIEVAAIESQHHLHFFDNKVLPMQLSPEQARAEKNWWYDPQYIITELNVNSAIAKPAHGDTLEVSLQELAQPEGGMYTIRGYAYSGGGRRITRVEVSLDGGDSWKLSNIEYPEDLYREFRFEDPVYGTLDLTERDTCFCWCFWSFETSVCILARADVIMVRAMDQGLALQPRDMYLNATSMMNNWWFKVAILKSDIEDGIRLHFEHPTASGAEPGGWMERMKNAGQDILKPNFGNSTSSSQNEGKAKSLTVPTEIMMTSPTISRRITVEELRAQDRSKPWFVVKGEVYDGTSYLKDHPGGDSSILLVAGDDATEDFMAIHSGDAKKKLAEFHIGTLVGSLSELDPCVPPTLDTSPPLTPFLEPKTWKSVKLTTITKINHDSYLYRFALPHMEQPLSLPVGQHVFVRLRRKDTGEVVQRAYTPVSQEGVKGEIEFLVKLYLPNAQFPLGGKMTTGFHQLEVGDAIEIKGPLGSFVWQRAGMALWRSVPRKVTEIGMVCGGSGITPILQVLRSVLHDSEDTTTRIWLISANKIEEDILCREELDDLYSLYSCQSPSNPRFHLHYTLTAIPGSTWAYSSGRITNSMLKDHLPEPSDGGLILACGPESMIERCLKPGLSRCGWDIDRSLVVF